MQANYVQRLRFTISKEGPARYIGHLDLARTLERSLNRARIPVAYTQGFNRRPRMQFAAALPLGYTSACERVDILLGERMEPGEAQRRLAASMAPGITVKSVQEVPLSQPALQAQTVSSWYQVTCPPEVEESLLAQRVRALLAAPALERERRGKKRTQPYDLRALIYDLQLRRDADGGVQLLMHLSLGEGATGRPGDVLQVLGIDPHDAWVHRLTLSLESDAQP